MQRLSRSFSRPAALLLGLVAVAVAHGHDEGMDMDMSEPSIARPARPIVSPAANAPAPMSYWQYDERSGLLVAHIAVMVLAWVFILPMCVMLSISRSRLTLPVHLAFLATNALGILLVTAYNHTAPDFYPNNAHHKLGWLVTWVTILQLLIGLIGTYAQSQGETRKEYMPASLEAIAANQRIHDLSSTDTYRFSNDSGQGTERNTESLRSHSFSSQGDDQLPDLRMAQEEDNFEEKDGLLHGSKMDRFLSRKLPGLLSARVLSVINLCYSVVDRIILILGFIALTTGVITYGGFFMGPEVYSGLAHWIKGGIFFWYGILSLGRWAGSFADIGWSWNVKPSNSKAPSAEFAESFLIFLYGITNVWMEHLAAWGKAWSAQDLEHVSITIMFFGGGLCGMLIESKRIRDMLNVTQQSADSLARQDVVEPRSYRTSMNPIPALIVLLLGLMMSSHHQETMVSTMIHKQWGMLLVGAAFARAATYVIFYLSPPTSVLPGRPPTELITAFCLMAGGVIFMASAHDTVKAMDTNDLDAMFIFTVTMGVITFLMAWIILVIAVKGLVVRRQNRTTHGNAA